MRLLLSFSVSTRQSPTRSTTRWVSESLRYRYEEVQCACNPHHTVLGYIIFQKDERMAHTTQDKAKLLSRVRRIRGQWKPSNGALEGEQECSSVLQLMAACRGALNGLMAELMEGHIRFHVLDAKSCQERSSGGSGRRTHRRSSDLPEVVSQSLRILRKW